MGKKILVVDDDPTSLKIVEGMLSTAGYKVVISTHAEDIEQRVKIVKPDLIIMDLMMPNVDGNQAVEKIKRHPSIKGIPIIFLTALQVVDQERGIEFEVNVGNENYRTLSKPIDAKTLVAEIEKLAK